MHKHIGILHLFENGLVHVTSALDFRDVDATGEFRFHGASNNAYIKAVCKERRGNRNGGLTATAV